MFKSSGYKSFYTTFEGPNVNEIISYFGYLQNKILDLIMCKKNHLFSSEFFKKYFGVKKIKLNRGYDYFWFLLT